MALKALNKIKRPVQIELEAIQKSWKLEALSQEPYYAHTDEHHVTPLGTKTTVVITSDSFDYGEKGSELNLFEKLTIKTPVEMKPAQFNKRQEVKIVSLSKATTYGDYQNQLSLEGILMDAKEYETRLKQQQK
ncbi:hypothetical protein [Candidatus Enterococcus mansonii]|uniref:Uncharacterized protein n=1 Tax=Candidatus Enterococcus mansonii TaxID=1834181 RepID=A0A242CF32_9ENTE|nr:hypothetical protein [Enterococcus sp. 4G2_DIV0659]OTO08821.1 hypothetical protein A5880_001821 [Enterococcus sp. 4G2_DIV0659]